MHVLRAGSTVAGVIFLSLAAFAANARGEGLVYLEVVTAATFPIEGSQELGAKLREVGAESVRIRTGSADDRPALKVGGTERSPVYYVTAVVDSNGRLHLPGATLSTSSVGPIREWIAKVKAGGEEGLSARPSAFGLNSKELLDLHEKLATAVKSPTKGKLAGEVVATIAGSLRNTVTVTEDSTATAALAGGETVAEEMLGLSSGTALAAVLRPLGLVIVPRKARTGDVGLLIIDARRSEESWPVGWPLEKAEKDVLPDYYKFLPVEINDFALTDALDALQSRLQAPFLFDHNSLARQGIEPAAVKVSHPKGQTYYKKVVDRLLAQAKLKAEMRVDEAGRPLLWISTIAR